MNLLVFIVFILLMIFCIPFRVLVCHPFKAAFNAVRDLLLWFIYHKWRNLKTGSIVCYVGLFGKGKTLSSVREICRLYRRYNNKKIYDPARRKWVIQKVNVLSNVELSIPYVSFTGLQQIVNISKSQAIYDKEHDVHTITLVLGDEFSVQLNSRSFKKNIDPLFLNTLLTCRHHHISLVYTAQRFGHVDALLRQVTSYVIDCNKLWRIMVHGKYDAWDMENSTNPTLCKPLRRFGWFITDRDFNAYDTLACVDNLTKACEDGDLLSSEEILALQASSPSDLEALDRPSRKLRRRWKKRK